MHLLLYDNFWDHRTNKVQQVFSKCGFIAEVYTVKISHLIAASDFLFKHLEKHSRRKRFASDKDFIREKKIFYKVTKEIFFEAMDNWKKDGISSKLVLQGFMYKIIFVVLLCAFFTAR